MPNISFAQNFEDAMLCRALSNIKNGFYIDVGAFDPHEDSVTKLFYLNGWRGINIEPLKEKEASFKAHRPLDINLSCAVSNFSGLSTLVSNGGLSYLQQVKEEREHLIGQKIEFCAVTTLAEICEEHVSNNQVIHFLKIDVEGSERKVIEGANWKRWRPWIVVIESTIPTTKSQNHLEWEGLILEAGYKFCFFDGLNRFYLDEAKYDELIGFFQSPINIFDDYVKAREALLQQNHEAILRQLEQLKPKFDQIERENVLELEALKMVHSEPGLNIISSFRCSNGIGQSARIISNALRDNGVPISNRNVNIDVLRDTIGWEIPSYNPARKANLLCWDVLGLSRIVKYLNRTQFNIVYPWWELEILPEFTPGMLSYFDEVWAPSRFIADIISPAFKHAVEYVPQPLIVPAEISLASTSGVFRVFTFFDTDSWQARKNPVASVKAFQSAFPKNFRDVQLVVKIRGGFDQGARRWLKETAAHDHRIVLVEEILSRSEMDKLTKSCHVFISLHRSEGLGLGPAEALAFGKPVVATDYSGTKDFITSKTGFPVSYKMTALVEGDYPVWANQQWADPDVEHAALHLRNLYDDYETGLNRAELGRKLLQENHSPEKFASNVKYLLGRRGLVFPA